MNYDKIGKFIQDKRKNKDLTQKELAKKLNVTDKAVSKWERGLGCPDVSLLERLSDILEVSILSILNGEETNQENMNIEEINNAVLKTIHYSKKNQIDRIKLFFSNLLIAVVVCICGFLVVANISHILYLNSYNNYILKDDMFIKETNELLPKINNNIKLIKESNKILSSKDKQTVVSNLEVAYENIKNNNMLSFATPKKITMKVLYEFEQPLGLNNMKAYEILAKYDLSFKADKDLYISHWFVEAFGMTYAEKKVNGIYKYESLSNLDKIVDPQYIDIQVRTANLYAKANQLYNLTYNIEALVR